MKQKGFTLIELLVVIVIIGILATISVATFSGYFAKARDSERQSAVRNAATLMKTARAVDTITTFTAADAAAVAATLNTEGGYSMPQASATNYNYLYAFDDATGDEFAIVVCSEDTADTDIIDGTSAAVAAVGAVTCAGGDVDPTDDTIAGYTLIDITTP